MQMKIAIGIGLMGAILLVLVTSAFIDGTKTYTVTELQRKMEAGESLHILDVRTLQEFNGELGHLPGAQLIPVQDLQQRLHEIDAEDSEEIVIICRTDNRSRAAASILRKAGITNVSFVRGGMMEWNRIYGRPE